MCIAAIKDQPILRPHRRLYIQPQLQRMHQATFGFIGGGFTGNMGLPLVNPSATALFLQIKPGVPTVPEVSQCTKRLKEGSRIAQQHLVGSTIIVQLLKTAVHADQRLSRGKERRVTEIHLVVQAAADHDHHISLLSCRF